MKLNLPTDKLRPQVNHYFVDLCFVDLLTELVPALKSMFVLL